METAIAPEELEALEQSFTHMKKDMETISYTLTLLKQRTTLHPGQLPKGVDGKLASLLGTQPVLSLAEEKKTMREIISQRFAR